MTPSTDLIDRAPYFSPTYLSPYTFRIEGEADFTHTNTPRNTHTTLKTPHNHTPIIRYLVFRVLHCNRRIKASFWEDFHNHGCKICLWIFHPCKYGSSLNSLGWWLLEYGLIYLPLYELDMGFYYMIWFECFIHNYAMSMWFNYEHEIIIY